MSDSKTRRWIVKGRVQGVSFRYFTEQAASFLKLAGWVRNLPDGNVEIRFRATDEEASRFREQVRRGPRLSRVDAIDEQELAVKALPEKFEIRF